MAIFRERNPRSQEARKGSKVRGGQEGFAIKVKYIFEKLMDHKFLHLRSHFFNCNERDKKRLLQFDAFQIKIISTWSFPVGEKTNVQLHVHEKRDGLSDIRSLTLLIETLALHNFTQTIYMKFHQNSKTPSCAS